MTFRRFKLGSVASVCALLGAAGCAEPDGPALEDATGHVRIQVTSSALSAQEVSSVLTQISSPTWNRAFDLGLSNNGGQWSGTLQYIPVGEDWAFRGSAYDYYGTLVYEGAVAPVAIQHDQTAFVSLNLDQVAAPIPFVNSAPRIQALTATSLEVQPTDTVQFSVAASDPDGDALSYTWTATEGTLSYGYGTRDTWTAPRRQGVYPVRIEVSDGRGLTATATVDITVLTTLQEGTAEVSVAFNTFPAVGLVSANVGRFGVNEAVTLSVAAVDSDGDVLSHAWSSTCEGSFDSADIESPVFTLSALPESEACTFTVVVDDRRGGTNQGSVEIAAGLPPEVDVGLPLPIALTQPGEAYGFDGQCSGWNACGNAVTCARWACQVNGYLDVATYGATGTANQYSVVHLMYGSGRDQVYRYWWNAPYCPLNVVTDITCR